MGCYSAELYSYIKKLLLTSDSGGDVDREKPTATATATTRIEEQVVNEEEEQNAVKEAFGVDLENKEFVTFECNSLILAAGGIHEFMQSVVLGFLKTMEKVLL